MKYYLQGALAVIGCIVFGLALGAAAPANIRFIPNIDGARYFRSAPDYVDARVLAATTNETHTVPASVQWVVFSSTCPDFYAKKNGAASIPAGDVTDGSASERAPTAWFVQGLTSIGLIAPVACTITLSFYY